MVDFGVSPSFPAENQQASGFRKRIAERESKTQIPADLQDPGRHDTAVG